MIRVLYSFVVNHGALHSLCNCLDVFRDDSSFLEVVLDALDNIVMFGEEKLEEDEDDEVEDPCNPFIVVFKNLQFEGERNRH